MTGSSRTIPATSAAFFPGSAHRRDTALAAARALDNSMYVVLAAAAGVCGVQECIGGSAVFGPQGDRLAGLGTEEGIGVADLDPAAVAETRAVRRMYADRRPSLGTRRRESVS